MIYKPSSVFDGYLSRRYVTTSLKQCKERRRTTLTSPILYRMGFTWHEALPLSRWSLTPPFHPYHCKQRRFISVALSLKSPSPVISRHPVLRYSDFPRRNRRNRLVISWHIISLITSKSKRTKVFSPENFEKYFHKILYQYFYSNSLQFPLRFLILPFFRYAIRMNGKFSAFLQFQAAYTLFLLLFHSGSKL